MSFRSNSSFARQMARDPKMIAALRLRAEAIKRRAESIAPRGHARKHYADQFVVVEEDGEVRVGNQDFAAHLVEFGSANNPPYAPLRRAVRAAGLELREEPKGS